MVGFRVLNPELFDSVYICPHCSLLLREPVQSRICAHRLCLSCVNDQESETIICPVCGEKTLRSQFILDRGFKNDMQTLLIICVFCDWSDLLKNYPKHLDETHPNPACGYCTEIFPSVNELNRHQKLLCQKIMIECPLRRYGCEIMIRRVDSVQHYRSDEHQKILINLVLRLKSCNQLKMISKKDIENDRRQIQEISETGNMLCDSTTVLSEDTQRVRNESISAEQQLGSVTKELSKLKISNQEQNISLNSTQTSQDICEQQIMSIQQYLIERSKIWCDGTLIWIIDNLQAKVGQHSTLYFRDRIPTSSEEIFNKDEYSASHTSIVSYYQGQNACEWYFQPKTSRIQ